MIFQEDNLIVKDNLIVENESYTNNIENTICRNAK